MTPPRLYLYNLLTSLLSETSCFALKARLLRWCGATVGTNVNSFAMGSDPIERYIYDSGSDWETLKEVHQQQLDHRMAKDTTEAAEKEEAVFTSGAIVGSDAFVRKIVQREEEAFPTGHKTPPVDFEVGGVVLKTLRNLSILR